jgi:hypothetical protein
MHGWQIANFSQLRGAECGIGRLIASRAPACALLLAFTGLGGPPFQTDDPSPVAFQHYQLYAFGAVDGTPVEHDASGPAAELGWGAVPDVQIAFSMPIAIVVPSNDPRFTPAAQGPRAYGPGDLSIGVKYRFIHQGKRIPMVWVYPAVTMPTGSAAHDLGLGKVSYRLPVWAQKDFGPWTTYGGMGRMFFPGLRGCRDFLFGGWLVQRQITKRLKLAVEVYHHGPEGLDTPQTQSATMIDAGGSYALRRNRHFQAVFCYGHTVVGQSETYAYAGLYWTWGKRRDSSKLMGEGFAAAP